MLALAYFWALCIAAAAEVQGSDTTLPGQTFGGVERSSDRGPMRIANIDIPEAREVHDEPVPFVLAGATVLERRFLEHAVLALYVPFGFRDAEGLSDGFAPYRLDLTWVIPSLPEARVRELMGEAFDAAETDPEIRRRNAAMRKRFVEHFSDVTRGDRISFEYNPDSGLRFSVNDQYKTSFTGADLTRTLTRMFLGRHEQATMLRQALIRRIPG